MSRQRMYRCLISTVDCYKYIKSCLGLFRSVSVRQRNNCYDSFWCGQYSATDFLYNKVNLQTCKVNVCTTGVTMMIIIMINYKVAFEILKVYWKVIVIIIGS